MSFHNSDDAVEQVVALLQMLSGRTRLGLLTVLLDSEHSVGELAGLLSTSKPDASQQLAILRSARLVAARRRGQNVLYSISDPAVRHLVQTVLDLSGGVAVGRE